MSELGTVDKLVAEVGQALLPLRQALASTDTFTGLLRELGWTASDIPQPLRDLGTSVETLYDAIRRLLGDGGFNQGGAPGDPDVASPTGATTDEAARVLAAVQNIVAQVHGIADAPASAIPAALRADGFQTIFPKQLLDYLVISYLQRFQPPVGFALRALGVVRSTYTPQAGGRPDYIHLELDLADLPRALSDPALLLEKAFAWGRPEFDFQAMASQLDNLLTALGLEVSFDKLSETAAEAVQGAPLAPYTPPPAAVVVSAFHQAVSEEAQTSAGVSLLPVPSDGPVPPGLALLPTFTGELGLRFELGSDIAVTIRSDLDLRGGRRAGGSAGCADRDGARVRVRRRTGPRHGVDRGGGGARRRGHRPRADTGSGSPGPYAVAVPADRGVRWGAVGRERRGRLRRVRRAGAGVRLQARRGGRRVHRGDRAGRRVHPVGADLAVGRCSPAGPTTTATSGRRPVTRVQAADRASAWRSTPAGHRRRLPRSFDPERGEYAGALELEFADFLALKAIGLITTRSRTARPASRC
jgi:hypothetical protein